MSNKNVPEQDGKFWIINNHDQLFNVSEDEFKQIRATDGSGFRRLKVGERVPPQGIEIEEEARARGISVDEVMSAPAFVPDAPAPKDIKALRRFMEANAEPSEEPATPE